MIKFLYNLNLVVLLALSLTFLSFFLVTLENFEWLKPFVEYVTLYLPVLLIPVTITMAILLFLRYVGKEKNEELGFDDFFAGLLAVGLQIVALIVWRAQGNEIAGAFASNIPNIELLTKNAGKIGVLGVAIIQFCAFLLYWKADPDPKSSRAHDAARAIT